MTQTTFQSLSIILPVMNETVSLSQTVEIIEAAARTDVREYIFVVCDRTLPQSLEVCQSFRQHDPHRFVVHAQTMPFLGGALREAFELVRGSHLLMMGSDLETDPHDVPQFISEAKHTPAAIITASRWIRGGHFEGYNNLKWLLNFVFQKFFSCLYWTQLSDMTYGYRLFPADLVRAIHWEELRHPFLFETLVKPLRLGIAVREIPSVWRSRVEGESQNTFFRNFSYFRIGLKVRFSSKGSLYVNQ